MATHSSILPGESHGRAKRQLIKKDPDAGKD